MSENIQLFQQKDPNFAGCLKLTPIECADFLLWAWENDKTAKVDFAMRDDDPHYLSNWWGVKISYEFDFTVILCGHYGELGDDFEAEALNTLMDEHRYDEDVCECGTHQARQVLTLAKFLTKLNEDYDGNTDYIFCELSADMSEWLTKVKEKEIVVVPIPEPVKPTGK
jgi:hypothetical protein